MESDPNFQLPTSTFRAKLRASRSGFTLVELIITIAIIAVLLLALILVLDPLELAAQARDTRRVSDLEAMSNAIDIAKAELVGSSGTWDPDGNYDGDGDMNTDEGCAGEDNQTVFVSVVGTDASGTCASPPDDLPTGWSYRCAPIDGPQDIDGTGWLPIDFTAGGTVTTPLSHLPTDPISTFASGHYYTYVCDRSSRGFEITARMTSKKFRTGGPDDIQSTDSGDDIFVYETGTDLQLDPKAPVGRWAFDEGSGTVARDAIGDNDGTFQNTPAWTTEAVLGMALDFERSESDWINLGPDLDLLTNGDDGGTWVAWVSPEDVEVMVIAALTVNSSATGRNSRLQIRYDGGGFVRASARSTNSDPERLAQFGVDYPLDVWSHVAAVADIAGDNLKVFYNGRLVGENSSAFFNNTSFDAGSADNSAFGAEDDGTTAYFDGEIDEVALYDRQLTAVEINYQYEALRP